MRHDRSIAELLVRGADDWVDASEVAWVAQSVGGAKTEAELQQTSLALVRQVVQQGLMKIGDVTEEGFLEWSMALEDALALIECRWTALGRRPKLGELFWLAITEQGNERVRHSSEARDSSS